MPGLFQVDRQPVPEGKQDSWHIEVDCLEREPASPDQAESLHHNRVEDTKGADRFAGHSGPMLHGADREGREETPQRLRHLQLLNHQGLPGAGQPHQHR